MSIIQNFTAFRVNESAGPVLHVHGSVLIPTPNPEISLIEAVPQGSNPTILLLNLIVKETLGPMKIVPHGVCYELTGEKVNNYEKVQITGNHGSITIDIQNPPLGNLIGKPLRVYATGEPITEDYIDNRVNIEINNRNDNSIVSIWFG